MTKDKHFYVFYRWLFFAIVLPYMPFLLDPYFPPVIAGFNMTGWAWMIMFLVSVYYFMLISPSLKIYPLVLWFPWMLYIMVYLLFDFTLPGLQLTVQILMPIFVGLVAQGFSYNKEKLHWLFRNFAFISIGIILLFFYGYYFRDNYTPNGAQTPMLLAVTASLAIGVFFLTYRIKYLLLYLVAFSVPLLGLTRMGIAVFLVILIFNFINKNILSKLVFTGLGVILVIVVFNSKGFQEKTFFSGRGTVSDLSVDYYSDEGVMNSSGRRVWYYALEKGLRQSPVFGNGPRSELKVLGQVTGTGHGEAHNDYLAVRYSYGYVGLTLLLIGFMGSFVSLYILYMRQKDPYKILVIGSTLVLFYAFLMFMYTDNIMKYTTFFPILFFCLIGMSFASFEEKK